MSTMTHSIINHPQSALADNLMKAFNYSYLADRSDEISYLKLQGMSGWRYRLLINNLLSLCDTPRYLEVGSWRGSTLCSAISGNKLRAVAIDNWSQFGGPKDDFIRNLEAFTDDNTDVSFIESDFRKVDYSSLGKFNVYLFDGPHGEEDQHDGISLAMPALDDEFILIVDDWNHPDVPQGTKRAIKATGLTITDAIEIKTTLDGSHPSVHSEHSEWHNGYFIGVLRKN